MHDISRDSVRALRLTCCTDRLQQAGTDLCLTDQQQRTNGIERRLAVLARHEWFGTFSASVTALAKINSWRVACSTSGDALARARGLVPSSSPRIERSTAGATSGATQTGIPDGERG